VLNLAYSYNGASDNGQIKREQIAWEKSGMHSRDLSPRMNPHGVRADTDPGGSISCTSLRWHRLQKPAWEGLNAALFDCAVAELINCGLYETNAIDFKFDQCSNPYFLHQHYEEMQKKPQKPSVVGKRPACRIHHKRD
jgi:hypothetical protein